MSKFKVKEEMQVRVWRDGVPEIDWTGSVKKVKKKIEEYFDLKA